MNVKRYFKPTAEHTKNKEKLKKPQQTNIQALESQEGLKQPSLSGPKSLLKALRGRILRRGVETLEVI
jgi:hypothetical protein